MKWSPSVGFQSSTQGRALSWSTLQALAPIIPVDASASTVSERDALKCPPVARAIGLYSATLLRHEWDADAPTLAWLNRAPGPEVTGMAGSVSPKLRDLRTLRDLILHNRALWVVARDDNGAIYDAAHLPAEVWGFNGENEVEIGGLTPAAKEFIYFPGSMAIPFLESAADTLSHYRDITNTIKSRGRNPMPLVELAMQEDYDGPEPGDEDYDKETDPLLAAQKSWGEARRSPEGAVAITPRNVKVIVHQPNDDGAVLIDARNAVRIDTANHCNLNAELLDGDNGTSDTYSTTMGNRSDFQELSTPLFFDPITLRLSMDDVTPPGVQVTLKPRPDVATTNQELAA